MADKELMTPREPRGAKNRRVSITMLRGSHILIPDASLAPAAVPAPAAAESTAPTVESSPASAH